MSRSAPPLPTVLIDTPLGPITAEIDNCRAPHTGRNFLRYVDLGLYRHAAFYRAVRPADDPHPIKISAVQGGLQRAGQVATLGAIPHEGTDTTGLRHDAGTLSMARGAVDTAEAEFFIVVDASPELDAGGARQPDGCGFAAFGRVIAGMEVVRAIAALEVTPDGELAGMLAMPVPITAIHRLPASGSDQSPFSK